MGKDPAILFYTQDFITGTMFFTFEQKGKYISLLCAQHQHGGLISKNDFNALVGDDQALRNKFIETKDGFFNERLMREMEKRSIKSTNLSTNAKVRWDKEKQKQCKSNAIASKGHMPTEDENEDEDVINNELVLKEEHILQKFIKKNCPNISKLKKQLTFQEAEKLFSEFTHPELQSVIEAMENYKPLSSKSISVNLTIRNWIKRDKQNGTDRKSSTRGSIDFNKWEREIRIARGEMPDVVPGAIQ